MTTSRITNAITAAITSSCERARRVQIRACQGQLEYKTSKILFNIKENNVQTCFGARFMLFNPDCHCRECKQD